MSLTNPSVVGTPVITPTCSVVRNDSSVFTCNILSKVTLLSFSMSYASLVGPTATATMCFITEIAVKKYLTHHRGDTLDSFSIFYRQLQFRNYQSRPSKDAETVTE